jgi:hypothetical protein
MQRRPVRQKNLVEILEQIVGTLADDIDLRPG